MKASIFTILMILSGQVCFSQQKFDEAYFRQFVNSYIKDPVAMIKTASLPGFTFIGGNGNKYSRDQILGVYFFMKEEKRDVLELTVNQFGGNAIASGIMLHVMSEKKSHKMHVYKVLFTYVFVQSDGLWKLAAAQHTDFNPLKKDDQIAVRKVIEEETASFFRADFEVNQSYFAHEPYLSRLFSAGLFFGDTLEAGTKKFWETHKPSQVKITTSRWNTRINGNSAYATFSQKKELGSEVTNSFEERYLERHNDVWKIVGITTIDNQVMKR